MRTKIYIASWNCSCSVISIGAAYILIKRKYIIDERKYEELVAEIKAQIKNDSISCDDLIIDEFRKK